MIKKAITYTDFAGTEKTEDWYFNLSDAELLQMELGVEGGSLSEKLKQVQRAVNGRFIMDTFTELLLKSVGEKSPDGALFLKRGVADRFEACGAFSVLFVEILGDPEKAKEFVNGLISPESLDKAVKAADAQKSSEEIRRASEAQMQGYIKPQHRTEEFKVVPDPATTEASISAADYEELQRLRAQQGTNAAPVQSQELGQGRHFQP